MKNYLNNTPIQIAGYLLIFISLFLPVDGLRTGASCLGMLLLSLFFLVTAPDSILAGNTYCPVLVLLGLSASISVAFLHEVFYSRLRFCLALVALPLSWLSFFLIDEPNFGLLVYLIGIILVFIAEVVGNQDKNKVPGAKNEIDAVKTEFKTPE